MRISSAYLQSSSLLSIQNKEYEQNRAAAKQSSAQEITNPSDNPYGAARLVGMDNEMSKSEQYESTRTELNNQLTQQDTALQSATEVLQSMRTNVVQALNGTLTDTDRKALAQNLRGDYETLVSVANTRDGSGNYLFSGYKSDQVPFNIDESTLTITPTADGKDYQGGDRMNYLIDSSRTVGGPATAEKVFQTTDGENTFNIIKDMVTALETSTADGTTTTADIQNSLSAGLKKIDGAIDNMSTVAAEGGTRMLEVSALSSQWADNKVNLQENINDVGAANMAATITASINAQVAYEASLKTYTMINSMSLLDLI